MKSAIRRVLLGPSLVFLALAAASCSAPELSDSPPPQYTVPEAPTTPPAPPPQAYADQPPVASPVDSDLLGGPAEGDTAPIVVASTPVPNPEDLSPEERARIYGEPQQRSVASTVARRRAYRAPRTTHARASTAARRQARAHTAARRPASHPAAAHAAAARTRPVHAKPSNAAPAKPPTAHPAATPKAHRGPAALAPPTNAPAKLDQLATAVRPDLIAGAKLNLSADVVAGKPGLVWMTMPSGVLDRLTAEAGKLGLKREARVADIAATLSGPGYAIVPNGLQTARLKAGEDASFNWQVTPSGQKPGPLAADISLNLKGGAKPESVALGQIKSQSPTVTAGPPKTSATAGNTSIGNGASAKTGLVMLLGLGLLLLVLIGAMMNRVKQDERLAEQRRKARAVDDALREQAANAPSHAPANEPRTREPEPA